MYMYVVYTCIPEYATQIQSSNYTVYKILHVCFTKMLKYLYVIGISDYAEIVEDDGDYSTPGSTYRFITH